MFEFLKQPLPWYIAGPLIGLTVPVLLIITLLSVIPRSGSNDHLVFGKRSTSCWRVTLYNMPINLSGYLKLYCLFSLYVDTDVFHVELVDVDERNGHIRVGRLTWNLDTQFSLVEEE